MKVQADGLALIDWLVSNGDLTLYVLQGHGSEHGEVATPIHSKESLLSFEELHNLLVGHENYLHSLESSIQTLVTTANYSHYLHLVFLLIDW